MFNGSLLAIAKRWMNLNVHQYGNGQINYSYNVILYNCKNEGTRARYNHIVFFFFKQKQEANCRMVYKCWDHIYVIWEPIK